MYRFKNSLFGLLGVLTLIAIATVALPHIGRGASGGGSAPTSQPQNVNVVNTPTVNTQQSGSWNVGINGTPAVTVANFPATTNVGINPAANTVKVDTTNPLPVRDVDNPAKQPFQASTSIVLPFGQTQGTQTIMVVPVGKVFVIEDISAEGRLAGVDKLISLAITTGGASYSLHPNDAGTDDLGRRVYSASQHVRLYVTAGNTVGCFAERNPATGQPGINFFIFGYFVDAQ